MIARFVKMHGAGNDYVFVDGIGQELSIARAERLASTLADRHFGIGGDGLILLLPSELADCRMVMWNADGSRGAMCGNGLRCLAKLAADLGHVGADELTVETDSGVKDVRLLRDARGEVSGARVDMGPVTVDARATDVDLGGETWRYHASSVGNPHAVVFTEADPGQLAVDEVGRAFQTLDAFQGGVNVEFVRVVEDGALAQRTFERGSGETLACGSGATAAAIAAVRTGRVAGPRVVVHLRGGDLVVEDLGAHAALAGPAVTVFTGQIALERKTSDS